MLYSCLRDATQPYTVYHLRIHSTQLVDVEYI